jgi:hypothetical protein
MERVHDIVEWENEINNRLRAAHCDGPIHGDELRGCQQRRREPWR